MIYLYGGSFDPITLAHLAIIQKVFTEFVGQDDRLHVLVSNNDSKKMHDSCRPPLQDG